MKKIKLIIMLAVMTVLSILVLTGCPDDPVDPAYHTVIWTAGAGFTSTTGVTATVDGVEITSGEEVLEGSTIVFSWTAFSEGCRMRILVGTTATYLAQTITTFNHIVSADVTILFSIATHNYAARVRNNETRRFSATCTIAASYWFSCYDCDAISTTLWFIYGTALGCDFGTDPDCGDECDRCNNTFICNECADCIAVQMYNDLRSMGLYAILTIGTEYNRIRVPYDVRFGPHPQDVTYQSVWFQGIGNNRSEDTYIRIFPSYSAAESAFVQGDVRVDNVLIRGGNVFSRWLFSTIAEIGAPGSLVDPNNPGYANPYFYNQLIEIVVALELLGLRTSSFTFPHVFIARSWGAYEGDDSTETANFVAWIFACEVWTQAALTMPYQYLADIPAIALTHTFGTIAVGGYTAVIDFVRDFVDEDFCSECYPDTCTCDGYLVLFTRNAGLLEGIGDFWVSTSDGLPIFGGERLASGTVINVEFEVLAGNVVQLYIRGRGIYSFRAGRHTVNHTITNQDVVMMFRSLSYIEYVAQSFWDAGWFAEVFRDDFGGERTYGLFVAHRQNPDGLDMQSVSSNQRALGLKHSILVDLGVMGVLNEYVAVYQNLVFWGTRTAVTQALLFLGVQASSFDDHMTRVVHYTLQFDYLSDWVDYIISDIDHLASIAYLWPEFKYIIGHYGFHVYIDEGFIAHIGEDNVEVVVMKVDSRENALALAYHLAVDCLTWGWDLSIAVSDCGYIVFVSEAAYYINRLIAEFGGTLYVITTDNILELNNNLTKLYLAMRYHPDFNFNLNPFRLTPHHVQWWHFNPYITAIFSAYELVPGENTAFTMVFMFDTPEYAYNFALAQAYDRFNVIKCGCCERIVVFGPTTQRWGGDYSPVDKFISGGCWCHPSPVCFDYFMFSQVRASWSQIGDWKVRTAIDGVGDDYHGFDNITIHLRGNYLTWRVNNVAVMRARLGYEALYFGMHSMIRLVWVWIAEGHTLPNNAMIREMGGEIQIQTGAVMTLSHRVVWFERFDWTPTPGFCLDCEQEPCMCCDVCNEIPCICPCPDCNENPCICPCLECGEYPCECPCLDCGELSCICFGNGNDIPLNIVMTGLPNGTIVVVNNSIGIEFINTIPGDIGGFYVNIAIPDGFMLESVNINGRVFTKDGEFQFNSNLMSIGLDYYLFFVLEGDETAITITLVVVCEDCGENPCECPCLVCGEFPCECPCPDCGEFPCECEPEIPQGRFRLDTADTDCCCGIFYPGHAEWNMNGGDYSFIEFINENQFTFALIFIHISICCCSYWIPEIETDTLTFIASGNALIATWYHDMWGDGSYIVEKNITITYENGTVTLILVFPDIWDDGYVMQVFTFVSDSD